jgi:hypothetical protein
MGLRLGARSFVGRGTALRYGPSLLLTAQHGLGDIEATVAGAVLGEIRIPVVTRADDVQILFLLSDCQPTGASPVAVAAVIGDEPADELPDELLVGAKVIATGLGLAVEAAV